MKCFYHSADLDGHCSGAIVKHKYPECEMIPINYGQEIAFADIELGETVFMVDFCLQPFKRMVTLNEIATLHWIDHHAKGSIDEAHVHDFQATGGQLLQTNKAGCELTWDYLFPDDPTPLSVWLLGRYDIWDHSDDRVLPYQYGMRQYKDTWPDNQALWETLLFRPAECNEIIGKGKMILEYEASQNEKFCKAYAFETEFNELPAICVNRGFTNSKVFDSVYDPEKHKLMITFVRLKLPKKLWTVSLYSTHEDIDCGEIAKRHGGGGHKGAAGFQCQLIPFEV